MRSPISRLVAPCTGGCNPSLITCRERQEGGGGERERTLCRPVRPCLHITTDISHVGIFVVVGIIIRSMEWCSILQSHCWAAINKRHADLCTHSALLSCTDGGSLLRSGLGKWTVTAGMHGPLECNNKGWKRSPQLEWQQWLICCVYISWTHTHKHTHTESFHTHIIPLQRTHTQMDRCPCDRVLCDWIFMAIRSSLGHCLFVPKHLLALAPILFYFNIKEIQILPEHSDIL